MLNPQRILSWLETNVKGMRRSRMKTLADIVPAAMELCGVGLLALGRAMPTDTTAKHNIKQRGEHFEYAIAELQRLATLKEAPNWG